MLASRRWRPYNIYDWTYEIFVEFKHVHPALLKAKSSPGRLAGLFLPLNPRTSNIKRFLSRLLISCGRVRDTEINTLYWFGLII